MPGAGRRLAIHQKGIAGNVGQIGAQHAHLIPVGALTQRAQQAIVLNLAPHIGQGFTLILIIFGGLFQIFHDLLTG